jgi:hypothetical protein
MQHVFNIFTTPQGGCNVWFKNINLCQGPQKLFDNLAHPFNKTMHFWYIKHKFLPDPQRFINNPSTPF